MAKTMILSLRCQSIAMLAIRVILVARAIRGIESPSIISVERKAKIAERVTEGRKVITLLKLSHL